jgi:glycosyltransferase involved in cell wall biosynthesis
MEKIVKLGSISVLGPGSIAGVDFNRFHTDIPKREFERNNAMIQSTTLVFLFVGRLTKDKGIFDLLHAYSIVATYNPKVELWIVGPDEEGLIEQLQERAGRLTGRIRWCGVTSQPERFMVAADVLVLPSYREGFGSVVIEAAACGVPTVAYRIDGVIDAVVEGHTGVLVQLGDIDALAAAMLELSVMDEKRNTLGRQAFERVVRDYSSNAISAEWLRFYTNQLMVSI